ncbi:unnamed protein product [Chrysoparadoxa australica]
MAKNDGVIIIGAGLSGLTAALHLTDAQPELKVIVLEGRDRVGGRLYAPAAGLDVGGAWAWKDNHPQALSMAARLNVGYFMQNSQGDALNDPGGNRAIRRVPHALDAPKYRFTHGAQSLAVNLAELLRKRGVAILLETTVSEVHVRGGGDEGEVTVTGESSQTGAMSWQASFVICAVPPALCSSSIEWKPAFGASFMNTLSSTPTWMERTTKVLAIYRSCFWREAGLSGEAQAQGPLHQIYDSCGGENGEGPPYALCAFIFGGTSGEFGDAVVSEYIVKEAALEHLARLFGPAARQPLHVHVKCWGEDPFTSAGDHNDAVEHEAGDAALRQPLGCTGSYSNTLSGPLSTAVKLVTLQPSSSKSALLTRGRPDIPVLF